MGNTLSSISICPGMDSTIAQSEICTPAILERTLHFAFGVETTREVTYTGISLCSIGVELGARGYFRRWEGFSGPTG